MKRNANRKYFNSSQLDMVDQAVGVAEELISDWFKLTIHDWKKYRYELKTRRSLTEAEVVPEVFAQILRYGHPDPPGSLQPSDFYRICLQDQNILGALRRDPQLKLLPLLIYVVTHELVHIVRFYKFVQFFHADDQDRQAEEVRVHALTYDVLKTKPLPDLHLILDFYARHRELVD